MNKWLQIVQKYIFTAFVVVFGMLFVYGLIFATPLRGLIVYLVSSGGIFNGDDYAVQMLVEEYPVTYFLVEMTEIIGRTMMILGIVGMISAGLSILYRSQIRKNYYKDPPDDAIIMMRSSEPMVI